MQEVLGHDSSIILSWGEGQSEKKMFVIIFLLIETILIKVFLVSSAHHRKVSILSLGYQQLWARCKIYDPFFSLCHIEIYTIHERESNSFY